MVAFTVSVLVTVIMIWIFELYRKRCPADKEFTWGEAMVFATYVFFVLFWVYGVVPHQWLTWADSELNWRPDRFVTGPKLPWTGEQGIIEWALPFTITYLAIRDILAVLIYGIALAGNVVYWRKWQNRGVAEEEPIDTSEYGRPLVKEGVGI